MSSKNRNYLKGVMFCLTSIVAMDSLSNDRQRVDYEYKIVKCIKTNEKSNDDILLNMSGSACEKDGGLLVERTIKPKIKDKSLEQQKHSCPNGNAKIDHCSHYSHYSSR